MELQIDREYCEFIGQWGNLVGRPYSHLKDVPEGLEYPRAAPDPCSGSTGLVFMAEW
jgi:hypothetical protein